MIETKKIDYYRSKDETNKRKAEIQRIKDIELQKNNEELRQKDERRA